MLKQKLLKASISSVTFISLAIALVSCTNPVSEVSTNQPITNETTNEPVSKPLVIATSDVICDLTKQIAADTIDLKCLIEAGTDPHNYKATPADIKAIANSKLVLYNGYNFEPTLIKAIQADTGNAQKIAIAEVAVTEPIMAKGHHHDDDEQDEKHDHDEDEKIAEDVTEPDPHIWHDAQNGLKMVEAIANELKTIQPEQAEVYQQNRQKLETEISAIDTWIKTQISTIPPSQRKLVTTHDALGYFALAYDISLEGALQGISTEEKATPTRLKDLIATIKTSQVPTIFAEASSNPKLIETVSKEAQVKVSDQPLFTDGLGDVNSNANTYQTMLIANTKAIVEGLGGKYVALK